MFLEVITLKSKTIMLILILCLTFSLTPNAFASEEKTTDFSLELNENENIPKKNYVNYEDTSDPVYLYNKGYSKELIRVVQEEKIRTHGEPLKRENRVIRYIKGLLYEPDFTEHNTQFGQRRILSK